MKYKFAFILFFLILLNINLKAADHSILKITEKDFVLGNEDALVTIIAYESMSCSWGYLRRPARTEDVWACAENGQAFSCRLGRGGEWKSRC